MKRKCKLTFVNVNFGCFNCNSLVAFFFVVLFSFWEIGTQNAHGQDFRVGAGAGVWDSGDSRFRPAVVAEAGWVRYGLLRYYSYGFTKGPVSQFGGATSLGREWNLSKDVFRAGAGFAHVWEKTKIKDVETSSTQHQTVQNLGFCLSTALVLEGKSTYASISWQNNFYLSKAQSIVGAFGRRQFVTLQGGFSF